MLIRPYKVQKKVAYLCPLSLQPRQFFPEFSAREVKLLIMEVKFLISWTCSLTQKLLVCYTTNILEFISQGRKQGTMVSGLA